MRVSELFSMFWVSNYRYSFEISLSNGNILPYFLKKVHPFREDFRDLASSDSLFCLFTRFLAFP